RFHVLVESQGHASNCNWDRMGKNAGADNHQDASRGNKLGGGFFQRSFSDVVLSVCDVPSRHVLRGNPREMSIPKGRICFGRCPATNHPDDPSQRPRRPFHRPASTSCNNFVSPCSISRSSLSTSRINSTGSSSGGFSATCGL